MANTGDWQGQYVVWPDTDVFPDESLYPDNVHRVTGNVDVWSKDGQWRWEKITDTSAVEAMLEAAQDLKDTIATIPITLDMVVGTADGKVVNATVVEQLISRYVTAQEGEFVKITSGQIAAGAISADMIQAGAIDGKVITGATIQSAASGTNPRVFMNSAGIFATDSSGSYSVQIMTSGTVKIRGNLGLESTYFESNLVDMGTFTVDAVSGATEALYSGPGLTFRPKAFPHTGSVTSIERRGMIGPSFVTSALNTRYPNSGLPARTGTYGIVIASPTRASGESPSTLRVEEGGLLWTAPRQSSTTYNSYGSAALKAYIGGFLAQGGTGVGAYQITATPDRSNYKNSEIRLRVGVDTNATAGRIAQMSLKPGDLTIDGAGMGNIKIQGDSSTTGSAIISAAAQRYATTTANRNTTTLYLRAHYNASGDGDPFAVIQRKYYSNATRSNKYFYTAGGASDDARVYLSRYVSGLAHQSDKYIAIGSTGFYAAGGKNFITPVPGFTENTGLWLRHAATESPHHGIEYWTVVELDENGEAVWTLPEYVAALSSDYAAKAVFATCSTGTVNAELVVDGSEVRVYARNGTPGATVNLLAKLGRRLHKGYTEDGQVDLEDMPDPVWLPAPIPGGDAEFREDPYNPGSMALSWDGTVDGMAYGPQTEEEARGADLHVVQEILNDYTYTGLPAQED